MKKTVISLFAVGVLISAATTSVFAAGGGKNYTDSDNNGICDYTKQQIVSCTALCSSLNDASAAAESAASKTITNAKYIDADNDGICDNYTGSGNGSGSSYVDSDNDGVCDNYANRVRPQDGTGNQHGCGYGKNR